MRTVMWVAVMREEPQMLMMSSGHSKAVSTMQGGPCISATRVASLRSPFGQPSAGCLASLGSPPANLFRASGSGE